MTHRTFIIFDDEDLKKLQDNRPVYFYLGEEQLVFFSNDGYKEFQKFWGKDEEEGESECSIV